jgi:hypothetical protein
MIAITTCRFKRTEQSKYENGFAVCKNPGEGDVINVIDRRGFIVEGVYDYSLDSSLGAIVNPMSLVLDTFSRGE